MSNLKNAIPAKVGTQPWLIVVDGRSKLEVGKTIRFRDYQDGSKWQHGIVNKLEPILFLELM